jgi:murein DD-endopeptidase MepM/ murein hydrolase activator NlpD
MNKLWLLLACLPLRQVVLTSGFGYRVHPVTGRYAFHSGIDLRARSDTVFAVLPGHVSSVSYNPLLGLNIRLDHGGLESSYGHLSQVFVFPADSVGAGCPIGITGSTGRVTGEHLHFSMRLAGRYINPLEFLKILTLNKEN